MYNRRCHEDGVRGLEFNLFRSEGSSDPAGHFTDAGRDRLFDDIRPKKKLLKQVSALDVDDKLEDLSTDQDARDQHDLVSVDLIHRIPQPLNLSRIPAVARENGDEDARVPAVLRFRHREERE